MIETWRQVTCDGCGETDNSTMPNLTVREFRSDLRRSGWRFVGGRDLCGPCKIGRFLASNPSIAEVRRLRMDAEILASKIDLDHMKGGYYRSPLTVEELRTIIRLLDGFTVGVLSK